MGRALQTKKSHTSSLQMFFCVRHAGVPASPGVISRKTGQLKTKLKVIA